MKVIIKKTGKIEEVSDGHANNYLIPKGLAVPATKEEIDKVAQQHAAAADKRKQLEKEWDAYAERLEDMTVTVEAQANEDGTLFGSLPESAILDQLSQSGMTLETQWIKIPEHIKHTGTYTVEVAFPHKNRASVTVNVQAQS